MARSPLASPGATRALLEAYGLATKHSLGQNFLVSDRVIEKIMDLADLAGTERVLEVGQGRGTKTLLLESAAIASGGPCEVTAVEVSPRKSELARRRMEAAGVADHVRSICADGRVLPDELGTFDLVFLDAPCSGTGTLSRHPEIAWSLAPGAPAELAALQAELLAAAAARVAPGGRLVYATCSVLAEENDAVVGAFLADPAAKGFELGRTGLTGPGAASDTHFHACLRRVR